jgi:hypothetical protein
MPGWTHRRIAALESIPGRDPDEPTDWIPLRHELGVRAFGINAFRADHVGQIIVERHQETDHEEAYGRPGSCATCASTGFSRGADGVGSMRGASR